MGPRRALMIAVALVATVPGGVAGAHDPVRAILGPGARPLADGHWEIVLSDGTTQTTHGPDPVPNHGGGIGPGDPERDPVCATDYYQHVLYGRHNGLPDRYQSSIPTIRSAIKRMNAVLNEESIESGDRTADYKVLCDDDGEIRVDYFSTSGNDFSSIVDSARAAGFDDNRADYSIFFDAESSTYCGVGSLARDDRLTESNWNNTGNDYAVTYRNCWNNETPMHETGHNQGAVQGAAPSSTGSGGHCNDENDVMCYANDGGDRNQSTVEVCTDRIHFDCGHDTYFDSAPEEGEWLATHWNLGSDLNRFIAFGVPRAGPPRAAFAIDCDDLACSFTDHSVDDGTIEAYEWSFGDGGTSTEPSPSHAYAEPGTYTVSLTVTDDKATSGSTHQILTVPNAGDPDPSVSTIENGQREHAVSAPQREWRVFKIYVPPGEARLQVELHAEACVLLLCNPDIDLYVARGAPPNRNDDICSSAGLNNTERCEIPEPPSGYYYLGIYTFFAPAPIGLSTANFTLIATF